MAKATQTVASTQYITITKEQLEVLTSGGSVDVQIGKRIKRTLLVGNLYEVKRRQLESDFQRRLADLEAEMAPDPID